MIPVIYGMQETDMERMKSPVTQGRLITGDVGTVKEGSKMAVFGCNTSRKLLPKYGML